MVWVFLGIYLRKVGGMEWLAFGLPFHPNYFPEGNPKENPYLPNIG